MRTIHTVAARSVCHEGTPTYLQVLPLSALSHVVRPAGCSPSNQCRSIHCSSSPASQQNARAAHPLVTQPDSSVSATACRCAVYTIQYTACTLRGVPLTEPCQCCTLCSLHCQQHQTITLVLTSYVASGCILRICTKAGYHVPERTQWGSVASSSSMISALECSNRRPSSCAQ